MHVHMHTYNHIYTQIHTHTNTHTNTYTHRYKHTKMHIRTYTSTHTHTQSRNFSMLTKVNFADKGFIIKLYFYGLFLLIISFLFSRFCLVLVSAAYDMLAHKAQSKNVNLQFPSL